MEYIREGFKDEVEKILSTLKFQRLFYMMKSQTLYQAYYYQECMHMLLVLFLVFNLQYGRFC